MTTDTPPGAGESLTEADMASVIRADLQAYYEAELEREFQRVFLGDVENWHPTGLLDVLNDD